MTARRFHYRSITLLLLLSAVIFQPNPAAAAVDGKLRLTIERQVIPAFRQGDSIALVRTLTPLLTRLTDEVRLDVDGYLQDQQIPSLGELLASARTQLIRQQVAGVPRPSQRELLLVLPVWHAELTAVVNAASQPVAETNRPPRGTNMEVYEKLFWELHVADNQLWNARQLASQVTSWTQRGLNRSNLSDGDRRLLDFDYQAAVTRIGNLSRQIGERELLLRAQRLGDAVHDLVDSEDSGTRLLAAFALSTDSRLLVEYLKQNQQLPDDGDPLTEPLTLIELNRLVQQGQLAAGEKLTTKAQLLFEGLHWWLRGRYGRGSEGGGLFKNKQVIKYPQLRLGLFMPTETPKPTPTVLAPGRESVPLVDRRHHYVWAWENQGVEVRKFQGFGRVTSREFY
jgi:hypothetical protein